MKIGINGFGRIGRLALRILWQRKDIEITHIVGYYYMANAAGRLLGTLLSGLLFMLGRNATIGLQYCLYASSALIFIAWLTSSKLPSYSSNSFN